MAKLLARRHFVIGLGLSGLGAALAACSSPAATPAPPSGSAAPTAAAAAPTKPAAPAQGAGASSAAPATAAAPAASGAAAPSAGGAKGGTLKLLYWQAPTILNPHLAVGTKDSHAARISLEPLMTIDAEGKFVPVLAAEIPSRENNGLSADGKTVTYKLKKDVKWSDGTPFTADDVVFTYTYVMNKETASTSTGIYAPLEKVEAVEPLVVRLTFKEPTAGWYVPFSGTGGMIVPKHQLQEYIGANARNAPFNLKPVGTGPYVPQSFSPGDNVVYAQNPNYRDKAKLAFDRVELKGGGDAPSAARAVFQTGEYDYAWNLLVEWPVLQDIAKGGKARMLTAPGGGIELLMLNQTDPNKEVDGEKSSLKAPHPFLTDAKVREAMALAIARDVMAKQLYGETADASPNIVTVPADLASKNNKAEFDLAKANQILDEAGYKKGGDGIRTTKEGARMKVVLATSTNSLRQKQQALVKDGWQKIGIETELKAVDASVFFGSEAGNNDSISHFYSDVQMASSRSTSPFPGPFLKQWYSGDPKRDVPQKANNWGGSNIFRWISPDFNTAYDQAIKETDPAKAKELWIKLNDLVVQSRVVIPMVERKLVSAASTQLKGPQLVTFDAETWNIADWSK